MHYLRVISLLTFLLPASVSAATNYGFGNNSCGRWTKERSSKSIISNYQVVWVLGFISGTGFALEVLSRRQNLTDADAVIAYVDNYCSNNPLDSIAAASQMLAAELSVSK
jgi:hypothetical protein